uniref:Phosphatidylinositol-4-phosphate 5-kinase, type I, beta b n=1 Tax=Cyprinus carpio TaxID=7962 RepID=A0A8C2GD29_CYPCA
MSSANENGVSGSSNNSREKTYKKTTSSALKGAIQLGIGYTVGNLTSKPDRDVLMQDFYVVESVFLPSEGSNLTPAHHYPDFRFKTMGGIPAKTHRDEKLLIFLGIIDILQSYRFMKKLEHSWKALVYDGDTVSVHRPSFYANRFLKFMSSRVFRKIQPNRFSPSKRARNSISALKCSSQEVLSSQKEEKAEEMTDRLGGARSLASLDGQVYWSYNRPDLVPQTPHPYEASSLSHTLSPPSIYVPDYYREARSNKRCACSTFTLEDSGICLTSEQSTMDIDRDDDSVLDVYFVSLCRTASGLHL